MLFSSEDDAVRRRRIGSDVTKARLTTTRLTPASKGATTVPYINHLAIPVDDVDRATAFYEDWFDAKVVPSPKFAMPVAWVLLGKVQVHLVLRAGQTCQAYHFAVTVESREQFEALYWRADREGTFDRKRSGIISSSAWTGLFRCTSGTPRATSWSATTPTSTTLTRRSSPS